MSMDRCYHCGETVSAQALIHATLDGAERAFCCSGCRAAAEWLHQGGLGDYYALRSEATGRVDAALDFSDWDSAGFRRLYVHEVDGQSECDLSIGNIRCAACAWLIDRVGQQMPGVSAITVDPATTHARVRFDPARVPLSAIAARLAAIGYAPRIVQDPADAKRERRQSLKRLVVAGLGAMQAMMLSPKPCTGAPTNSTWARATSSASSRCWSRRRWCSIRAFRSSAAPGAKWRCGARAWTCWSPCRSASPTSHRWSRPSAAARSSISTRR
jgi:hypothetical protein